MYMDGGGDEDENVIMIIKGFFNVQKSYR